MVNRPFDDRRPLGPFIASDDDDTSELDGEDKAIAQQAESWFESISDEKIKRKYMRNYLIGITDDDFSEERIDSILDEMGI